METIRLINRNREEASVQLQSVIKQAVANIGGIDEVILEEIYEGECGDMVLPVYYECEEEEGLTREEFLFNVDLSDYTVFC